jgi:hypothetical protein
MSLVVKRVDPAKKIGAKDAITGENNRRNMAKIKAVEIRAEVRQIKTMADGSVNVILNLPEDCKEQVKVLLDWLNLEVKAVIAI